MWFEVAFYTYLVLLAIIAVMGFVRFKKLSKAFQTLTYLILATVISESIKKVIGKIYQNNMPIAHLWAVVEYALFSLTYYYMLTNRLVKKAILISMAGIVVVEVLNLIFLEHILQFPSLILDLSQIIYVIYALLAFVQMLVQPSEQSLFRQSLFWFNLDMLFYGTTLFLNYALTSYFISNKLDSTILIAFSIVVNYIFYIVIGIAILIDNKTNNATSYSYG